MSVLDLPARLKDSALSALIGDFVGSGSYRDVYVLNIDPTKVIKIETRGCEFCNIHERDLYRELQGTKWETWLAPCYRLDAYGMALIQARTRPLTPADWKGVTQMPSFLADLKPANFGLFEGRVVAHDYGNHGIYYLAAKAARLVKVDDRKHDPENLEWRM